MRCTRYEVTLVRTGSTQYKIPDQKINDPGKGKEMLRQIFRFLADSPNERVFVVALDTALKIIGFSEVTAGTLDSSLVHPREVYSRAVLMNASAIFIIHNHPGGSLEFSRQDMDVHRKIEEAGKVMGIPLKDSFVLAPGFDGEPTVVSYHECVS